MTWPSFVSRARLSQLAVPGHLHSASLTRVLPQEPGRIEYYICLCGPLGGVSEIETSLDVSHLFKGHEELTPCSALSHSYLFPLLDVLNRQAGNLTFWTVRCTKLPHGGQ